MGDQIRQTKSHDILLCLRQASVLMTRRLSETLSLFSCRGGLLRFGSHATYMNCTYCDGMAIPEPPIPRRAKHARCEVRYDPGFQRHRGLRGYIRSWSSRSEEVHLLAVLMATGITARGFGEGDTEKKDVRVELMRSREKIEFAATAGTGEPGYLTIYELQK